MSSGYRFHPGTRLALLQSPGPFSAGMEARAVAFFREHAHAPGEVQWAVVVSDDSAAFDTVRLAGELSKSTRVRVQGFTDLAVALHWLLGAHQDEQIVALTRWIEDNE